jgi:hypothetical protein
MAWAELEMLLGEELLDAAEVAPPDGRDGGANE